MFRIAICEDEKIVLDFESSLVKKWAEEHKCPLTVDEYISAEQFLFESEDKNPYDVLIFDIQMKGINGMELAKKLRHRGCDSIIIFITGVPDYAIEGYEVGAIRYILKPVKPEILNSILDSAYQTKIKKAEEYFVLGQGTDRERILLNSIIYTEARGHYVFLKTCEFEREWKSSFSEVAKALENTNSGLQSAKRFFCLRRGLLVNLEHIKRITRTECLLDNEEVLPVARGVYKDLNEAFINYYSMAEK